MKKVTLKLILASSIAGGVLYAKPVTEQEAKNVALNFAYHKSGKVLKTKSLVTSDTLLKNVFSYTKRTSSKPTIRLIKLVPHGWVLVSADDVAEPILGYSLEGDFDENNLPPQLEDLLETYSLQIDDARSQRKVSIPLKTSLKWEKMKIKPAKFKTKNPFNPFAALSQQAVSSAKVMSNSSLSWHLEDDITLHTPLWGQGYPYNSYTPNNTPTGCVATAMAEIMGYHRFPLQAQNLPAIYNDTQGTHYNLTTELPMQNYNWTGMLNGTDTLDIARLMQHAGITVNMNYEPAGSGAYSSDIPNAMSAHFHYLNNGYHSRGTYRNPSDSDPDGDWKQYIRTDIRQGFPVYYQGVDIKDPSNPNDNAGHAFVIEGFCSDDGSDYYTFNFGWSGFGNGDFSLDNITAGGYKFTQQQGAIFSLKPNTYRDVFEGDNTYKTSSYTRVGDTQHFHSISPASDSDWITFWNDTTNATINIETIANGQTSGSHDTVMYLYDAQGNQLAYDDDGGSNLFSKISKRLYVGRYFIKVIGYAQDNSVSSYDLRVWK